MFKNYRRKLVGAIAVIAAAAGMFGGVYVVANTEDLTLSLVLTAVISAGVLAPTMVLWGLLFPEQRCSCTRKCSSCGKPKSG